MLSESLRAVISQTLCKTKDGQGRVAAHEIMLGTSAIRNLIREAKVAQMYSSIQTGNSVGMKTLDQDLTDLGVGLRRPEWVEAENLDLTAHLHRVDASLRGAHQGLDAAVAHIMEQALPLETQVVMKTAEIRYSLFGASDAAGIPIRAQASRMRRALRSPSPMLPRPSRSGS